MRNTIIKNSIERKKPSPFRAGFTIVILGFAFMIMDGVSQAKAEDRYPEKSFGVDVAGGFPQFIGLEFTYLKWSNIVPGIGFGSAPINGILNSAVHLPTVPVNFSLPDTYNLYPNANYSLYSTLIFVKYFFSNSGFFLDALLSSFTFNANIQGNLKDENTGITTSGAINGSATLTQLMVGLTVGYQFLIQSSFFIEFAAGGGYLLPPIYSTSISGTAASIVGVIPNGEQDFNNAKSQVQSAFNSAVNSYSSLTKFVPFAFIDLGFTF